jgi:thymidylate synthase (FAD)
MSENMLKVKLLNYTPEPERVVAMAARLCYSAIGAEELSERLSDDDVRRMVAKMVKLGHASTIEHVSFTFGVEGVSRVLTHQLVRHRIASYDQQSQRYVASHGFQYITPPSIAEKPEARAKFDRLMGDIRQIYDGLTELGIPKEDARYVLANAAETKIIITMNARSLLHFFNLRCCHRAQWEIRAMAYKMLAEVQKVAPTLFKNAGASCVNTGRCPEGDMTCGHLQEMLKMRKE